MYQQELSRGQQLLQRTQTFLNDVLSCKGTATHIACALANLLVIPMMLKMNFPATSRVSSYSIPKFVSHGCMAFSFSGMVYDNIVVAAGKYMVNGSMEDGRLLRMLTKGRYLFHGMVMPLLLVPIIEIAKQHGLIAVPRIANVMKGILISIASIEMIDWLHYDKAQFVPVDNTMSTKHINHVLAGTFKFTCPNILKCVLPAILATFAQIGSGVYMMTQSSLPTTAPLLVFLAGFTALLSASPMFMKRPDLQLVLEPASLLMIWVALSQAVTL